MSDSVLNDDLVARYLADNPGFFESCPDALAAVRLPQAHGGRAISLQERQLEVMREKHRVIERKLADLVRLGRENDAIGDRLQRWTRALLLAEDAQRLPGEVVDGLRDIFSVPQVVLRLWRVREGFEAPEWVRPVPDDLVAAMDALQLPYCGPVSDARVAGWLSASGADTRSMALMALRRGAAPKAFGLLALGSGDADRFQTGMGTAFLERIAETASAALSRVAGR
jgi:uncharacterized protein YigA (DUF484 family)